MPDLPTIERALVPCGGRGTRMLAITGGAPKELIDVGGVPAVVRVARECGAAGITSLLVVIAPGKEAIAGTLEPLAGTPGMPRTISVVVQPVARGLADAIRMGREFAASGAIAVALPDNLFDGPRPALAQVIDAYRSCGTSAVAVTEITAAEAAHRGATGTLPGEVDGDLYRITDVPPKAPHDGAFSTGGHASAFTAVGRYAFAPDVWDAIDEVDRTLVVGAELDDVPVMRLLHSRGRLVGRLVRDRFLDVGVPDGWREADALLRGR